MVGISFPSPQEYQAPQQGQNTRAGQEAGGGFWLPEAQNEKNGWWSAPSSLASLGHGDFLPPLPTMIQGPRDVSVVRHDQRVALAQDLQQCAIQ